MNTITIERSLLEQVLDAIQELEHASTAVADKKARDAKSNLRAALAAPATTPECKTSGGDARAVALARLLDQAYERGVAVGLSQAVPATAPEHLDPADLCDVCKEPVRYGSRHHACGEAMLRAKANAAPATAPEKTVQEIMEFARHYAANTFSSATLEDKIRRSLAAPATAPAWYDAQQAEIESLRWTVKDALESLDNGMTADCRATLSSATKETP